MFVFLLYVVLICTITPEFYAQKQKGQTLRTVNVTSRPPVQNNVRIVGGVEANLHEYPWIISFKKMNSHFCGGSILNAEWVLTAAHCVPNDRDFFFTIHAGVHNHLQPQSYEQAVTPMLIINHKLYNPQTFENDISLVQITPPFRFNDAIRPISVVDKSFVTFGNATVAGWGTTSESSHLTSQVLRKVSIPIIPDIRCAEQYGSNFHLNKMVCAGMNEGGRDSCQGDSGGPLMCQQSTEMKLCGIVSFGNGCARQGFAGVYTKVSSYINWINAYKIRTESETDSNGKKNTTVGSSVLFPNRTNSTFTTFAPTSKRTKRPSWSNRRPSATATIQPNSIFFVSLSIFAVFFLTR